MKLFAWQSTGHGEKSFFVMSENKEQAKNFVEVKIKEMLMDGVLITIN